MSPLRVPSTRKADHLRVAAEADIEDRRGTGLNELDRGGAERLR